MSSICVCMVRRFSSGRVRSISAMTRRIWGKVWPGGKRRADVVGELVQLLILTPGSVVEVRHLLLHARIMAVADHADNFDRSVSSAEKCRPMGLRPSSSFLTKCWLTMATSGAGGVVAQREFAAGRSSGNAHLAEIAGGDFVEHRVVVFAFGAAFDLQTVAPIVAGDQRHQRGGDTAHAGNGGQIRFRCDRTGRGSAPACSRSAPGKRRRRSGFPCSSRGRRASG